MRVQLVIGGIAVLGFMTGSTVAQAQTAVRTSLVINEVMPNPPAGQCPWIELYNPTDEPVSLNNVVFQTGERQRFAVPPDGPEWTLPGKDYLLIFFKPIRKSGADPNGTRGDGSNCLPRNSGIRFPADRPDLFRRESALTGELLLFLEIDGTRRPIDYVAWGGPGRSWSEPERGTLWPGRGFVELAEGFGVTQPGVQLPTGWSIGRYPGSTSNRPEDWVIFDADEIRTAKSQRGKNPVPRPKTFTLADCAEIGSQAFAVGWVGHQTGESFRFQLATNRDFSDIIFDEIVLAPVVRLSQALEGGVYYYRVTAFSRGIASEPSGTREVQLRNTSCDWPLPPAPLNTQVILDWVFKPNCGVLPKCRIISDIRFKFQRKDTKLSCCACKKEAESSNLDSEGNCGWKGIHPFCHRAGHISSSPSYILCAGGLLSPSCGKAPGLPVVANSVVSEELARRSILDTSQTVLFEKSCLHGKRNCVRASISMIVSAYDGSCLSQDVIANHHYTESLSSNDPIDIVFDLGHAAGMNCDDQHGAECSRILTWALGVDPKRDGADQYFYTRDTPSFPTIKIWIQAGRPIMSETTANHMRIIAGYCEGPGHPEGAPFRKWPYIYDPETGPRAETYESWSMTSKAVWAAPPVSTWQPSKVRQDPSDVWRDANNNSFMDYDDSYRIPLPEGCSP